MSTTVPKVKVNPVSAAMLGGLFVSTLAVWLFGDSGIYGVRHAQEPKQAPAVAEAPLPAPVKTAAEITGRASAVDSATVRIAGKDLPIAGLKPVVHAQAQAAFNDFLASAGDIACNRKKSSGKGSDGWSCVTVSDGTDVGEVAIFSGLAFAGGDASQRYLDAEKDAQTRKAGIWGAR